MKFSSWKSDEWSFWNTSLWLFFKLCNQISSADWYYFKLFKFDLFKLLNNETELYMITFFSDMYVICCYDAYS